jgi:hypothetical protein
MEFLHVCMHACMYECMHVCVYVCSNGYTYAGMCTHMSINHIRRKGRFVYMEKCMYVHGWVCFIHACIHSCLYMHAFIHVYTCMHAFMLIIFMDLPRPEIPCDRRVYMSVCILLCIYVCMHVRVYVYVYTYVCMYACTYVCICIYVRMHVCMHVCMLVCVYACIQFSENVTVEVSHNCFCSFLAKIVKSSQPRRLSWKFMFDGTNVT